MCFVCERSPLLDRLTSGLPAAGSGRREFLAGAALAVAVGSGIARRGQAAPVAADVIFRNGTIRTMAAAPGTAEALAIGGGRILAAGTALEAGTFAGDATRIIDLEGRTVLPGLIDPHHHSVLASLLTTLLFDIGTSRCRTRADAVAELKKAAAKTPAVLAKALTAYAARAAAAGHTTLHEPGTVKPEWVAHLAALSKDLHVRLSASFSTDMVEASKEADLTILESDPCTADPENIGSIAVSETWVAGEKKFG